MDLKPDTKRPDAVLLRDYRPPDFLIDQVNLYIELGETRTQVEAQLQLQRAPHCASNQPLQLDGDGLELEQVQLNGRILAAGAYQATPERLIIPELPERFELTLRTQLRPQDNTALSGLYKSSGTFCTQCEAEGFRRITYFLDRPDVMARYTTTLVADREQYPILLSNGNLDASGQFGDGRHWARWVDPFPKPSYLFALVAGKLAFLQDHFVTASGRTVELFVYVQPHNIDKCEHAMASLKKAMRWDEQQYGREYDLDRYMIVAVDDFNMGAMENKGLNIFNSKFVLARPDTATDQDYQNIEGVIGHEYFHNWSGNRVTCRDWFQLSLKEGFTVFRDQEFSAAMNSAAVKRIQDVNVLRTHQFREDAGPMAHPVRPDSYIEINNFYTATVYNKGAEVVRMLQTLVGPEGFRRATDLYFERHDGQAVTTEDFVRAVEDANGLKLSEFRHWYSQAGTPEIEVETAYNAAAHTYSLHLRQTCPPTPGQAQKLPFHIPLAMALLDAEGRELPLRLYGERQAQVGTRVLQLCTAEETFVFQDIEAEPVPSLLRGFSAPVRLKWAASADQLSFQLAHDGDAFCRWEAGQRLTAGLILELAARWPQQTDWSVPSAVVEAFARVLRSDAIEAALQAQLLELPSELYLAEFMPVIEPDALHAARQFVRGELARQLADLWYERYHALSQSGPYQLTPQAMGARSLRNLCLAYLLELDAPEALQLALAQYRAQHNMTDVLAALSVLAHRNDSVCDQILEDFYSCWKSDPLVVDKWLAVQALSRRADTLLRVQGLTEHPAFSLKNPNKVYALLRNFALGNPVRFHQADGAAYRFFAAMIRQIDALNPQVAARLVGAFNDWRRYDITRQVAQKGVLEELSNNDKLSKDVTEIIIKNLS